MHNINFNDGLEEIMINNDPKRVIQWNPTDSHFSKRYFEFTDYIKGLYERLQALTGDIETVAQVVAVDGVNDAVGSKARGAAEQITALGVELSEMLDNTFNAPISEMAFRGANPLSPTRDGRFLFDNFLTAIAPIVSASVEEANNAAQKRIRKYTEPVKKMSNHRKAPHE